MNKPIKKSIPAPITGRINGEQTRGRVTPSPKMELKPMPKSKNK